MARRLAWCLLRASGAAHDARVLVDCLMAVTELQELIDVPDTDAAAWGLMS